VKNKTKGIVKAFIEFAESIEGRKIITLMKHIAN